MVEKSKILKPEEEMDEEFIELILENMRDSFEWRTADWSISKLLKITKEKMSGQIINVQF